MVCHRAMSQSVAVPSIRVMLSAQQDSIIIRWAPDDAVAWKYLTQYGYKVERYTIVRDSAILTEKPMKVLNQSLKPAPESAWLPHMNDDMIALQAQCIFGESFAIETGNSIMDVKNQVDELHSRFSYSIFAADVSPKAASLGGLRLVDRDVKKNEHYLYRVYSLVPENVLKIDYGFAYVSPREVLPLPKPLNFEGSVRNNYAVLQFDANPLRAFYSAYFIERKDSISAFQQINKFPLLPLSTDSLDGQHLITSDSLPKNNWRYQYRIRGITPFGQLGPYSNEIVVKNFVAVALNAPRITDMLVSPRQSVIISWSIIEGEEDNIKGFDVTRSASEGGKFVKLNSQTIPNTARTFEDTKPLATNYYKVVAYAKNDKQKIETFSHLVQLEDSIPPSAPMGVVAVIDTASIVRLKWKANAERDLIGYRVYFSNFKNSEFSQLTGDPIAAAEFIDTLNSNTLSRKGYYKIAAVDNRYNTSKYSETIEIVRPDIVPPVPPVVKSIRNTVEGVELSWTRSSSEDVTKHVLYRRCGGDWSILRNFTVDSIFVDGTAEIARNCEYKFIAQDESGLSSKPTAVVTGKKVAATHHDKPEKIKAVADQEQKNITLSWSDSNRGITKYMIYRSEGGESISLYKSLSGDARKFVDEKLQMNTVYVYRLKAIYSDGTESKFSDKVEVKY